MDPARRADAARAARGFALLDVIIAGVLLAIGLSTIFAITARSLEFQKDGEVRVQAAADSQSATAAKLKAINEDLVEARRAVLHLEAEAAKAQQTLHQAEVLVPVGGAHVQHVEAQFRVRVDQLDLFDPVEIILRGNLPAVNVSRHIPHINVLNYQGLDGGSHNPGLILVQQGDQVLNVSLLPVELLL